jgi:hypothetical protein
MVQVFVPVFAFIFNGIFVNNTDVDRMVKLLQQGNSQALSIYFNPSIQLTTPGKQGVYSASQAKMIVSDFYETNKPSAAKLTASGNSDNGAQYISVELITVNGNFKVNISYRGSGENLKIHELKFEK